ncbi:sugar-binding transcriptional regulator [uncultured Paludibaculum sp.]|uniref:sugar-binding transcriptional regulator n=1 Tax=uncultured Paludibaculum sp. TaxID=1765020 RepID=UPI002AAC0EDF|nr:sugar-binding transcriptional regulator [uncultured Paludibaculum sp.]
MARIDELRLMAKIARMYYTQGLRQTEICARLNIHQSTVSRVLKRAEREGIVRITVSLPPGTHTDVEDALQSRFGLDEAVVVDCLDDEAQISHDLGAAAAFYLENTLKAGDVIGISSWSAALLEMVNAIHPSQRFKSNRVIQILGGVGSPNAEVHATQVTRRLADLIGGEATLLPAPGVVGSRNARDVLVKDRFVREALDLFPQVTLALVGIGATEPSRALASSGNIFSPREVGMLAEKGAVGDICLRFFDAAGRQVLTELNDRVISMELDQLQAVPRVVGVAGGQRKTSAIRGALAGKLINVLITDLASAGRLLAGGPQPVAEQAGGNGRASTKRTAKSR